MEAGARVSEKESTYRKEKKNHFPIDGVKKEKKNTLLNQTISTLPKYTYAAPCALDSAPERA